MQIACRFVGIIEFVRLLVVVANATEGFEGLARLLTKLAGSVRVGKDEPILVGRLIPLSIRGTVFARLLLAGFVRFMVDKLLLLIMFMVGAWIWGIEDNEIFDMLLSCVCVFEGVVIKFVVAVAADVGFSFDIGLGL